MGSRLNCALSSAALLATGGAASAADMLVKTPLDARAWINPILIANTQVGLGLIVQRFDYNESTASIPHLDSERGFVPGLQATVSAMAPVADVSNVYVMGRFTWLNGRTEYSAVAGPVTSDRSGADVRDVEVRFGKGFDIATSWMLTPYLGAGYRSWERNGSNRLGPFGYREIYQHGYVGAGLLLQWAATDRLVLSGSGLLGTTLSPRMAASFNGGAAITPEDYTLGSSTLTMAGLSADYAITPEWHANAGVDYLDFRYGASPVSATGYYEPDSRTSNWSVKAGFGYSFAVPAAR